MTNREHFCDTRGGCHHRRGGAGLRPEGSRTEKIQKAYYEADRVKFAYLPLDDEDVIAGVANLTLPTPPARMSKSSPGK